MKKCVSLSIAPMTKSCQVLPLVGDLRMISAVFTFAVIVIEPPPNPLKEKDHRIPSY